MIPRIYDREENTGRVIPKPDGSLRLLCGVEANICSTNGELDLEERYLQKMDYALASIHPLPLLREAARRIHWHLSELFRILM